MHALAPTQAAAAPLPHFRDTHVRICRQALVHNVGVIKQLAGPTELCAVIKADAYGHGAVEVAKTLEGAGVEQFAVALVEEGLALRRAGIRRPILVLAGSFSGAYEAVLEADLTPVVGHTSDLAGFSRAAAKLPKPLAIHLELDTGMARLGAVPADFPALLRQAAKAPGLSVIGVMSHFSHSDVPHAEQTHSQVKLLESTLREVAAELPQLRFRHIINSGALLTAPEAPRDMVRCGLSIFGVQPSRDSRLPGLRPVLSWHTRIVALRDIPVGAQVSYGGRFVASRPSRIATLPVGYADGYPRKLSMRAQVEIAGRRAPQVGNICMDLCMVDVTDIPEAQLGSAVILLGEAPAPGAVELAAQADTISWELLSRIGPRVRRSYVDAHDS